MRRLTGIALAGLAVVAVLAAVLFRSGSGEPDYRFAAVFDTAKSIVPGQQVKIAGAVVGRVKAIGIVPGPKARMVLSVDHRFGPFRADARCAIKPEGLISENFVECDPGRARAALAADARGLPVVPLARTSVPTSLQDVINVFALPTSQRLGALVSELGIAGSGRGREINDVLRRANPALLSTRRTLGLLAAQRDELGDAVGQTDRVLARLARGDQAVRGFVDRAADVAATTAARHDALAQTVHRLPGMLRAVRPGLETIDQTTRQATPLLRNLQAAAPGIERLNRTAPAFARAGLPALRSLTAISRTARPAIAAARPTARRLKRSTAALAAVVPDIDRFLVSLRDTGGFEGTLRIFYTLATLASSYDQTSHLINFIANAAPNCLAAQQAGTDSRGCSRRWDSEGNGTVPINVPDCGPTSPADLWRNAHCDLPRPPIGTLPDARKAHRKPSTPAATPPAASDPGTKPDRSPPAPVPLLPALPKLPSIIPPLPAVPALPTVPGGATGALGAVGGLLGGGKTAPSPKTDDALLEFLLG